MRACLRNTLDRTGSSTRLGTISPKQEPTWSGTSLSAPTSSGRLHPVTASLFPQYLIIKLAKLFYSQTAPVDPADSAWLAKNMGPATDPVCLRSVRIIVQPS